ncbi:MAG: hypothetical protein K0Q97_1638 [Bacillota bacterium]|jgi:hypothetical protein|nr:hypothetical protein [Bacillota bacterium]
MKDSGYKLLAILIVILLIALWLYVIIAGMSVGDYEFLILSFGYILWQILDKKLFEPWWKASKRPKHIIKSALLLSIIMFIVLLFCRYVFLKYGVDMEIISVLITLSIYLSYKYWKILRVLR